MIGTRIPKLTVTTPTAAKSWFKRMHADGLMFHPDDSPEEIIEIASGAPQFSNSECIQLKQYLDKLFAALGDRVYDIAFDVVSTTFHMRAERRPISANCG